MTARKTQRQKDRKLIAEAGWPWGISVCCDGAWFHVRAVLEGKRGKSIALAAARELNRIAREHRARRGK